MTDEKGKEIPLTEYASALNEPYVSEKGIPLSEYKKQLDTPIVTVAPLPQGVQQVPQQPAQQSAQQLTGTDVVATVGGSIVGAAFGTLVGLIAGTEKPAGDLANWQNVTTPTVHGEIIGIGAAVGFVALPLVTLATIKTVRACRNNQCAIL